MKKYILTLILLVITVLICLLIVLNVSATKDKKGCFRSLIKKDYLCNFHHKEPAEGISYTLKYKSGLSLDEKETIKKIISNSSQINEANFEKISFMTDYEIGDLENKYEQYGEIAYTFFGLTTYQTHWKNKTYFH